MNAPGRMCEVCGGRAWVILGGARADCPRPGCEGGRVDQAAPPFDVAELLAPPLAEQLAQLAAAAPALGPAVEYWSRLAVARGVIDRYRRELPEGAATVPAPDWLSWSVLLADVLGGLVAAIGALGAGPRELPPPSPPWVLP